MRRYGIIISVILQVLVFNLAGSRMVLANPTIATVFSFPTTATGLSPNGYQPSGKLTFDPQGNLYGTTEMGGSGCGIVYELAPPAILGRQWTLKPIYKFANAAIGLIPQGGLTLDSAGNVYGTAAWGGTAGSCLSRVGNGTVFKLTRPTPPAIAWTASKLFTFNGTNGMAPATGVFWSGANLIGTTSGGVLEFGDTGTGGFQSGTVFEISPAAPHWTYRLIYNFKTGGLVESDYLVNPLVLRGNDLFGADMGSVFHLSTGIGTGAWKKTILHTFGSVSPGPDGTQPHGQLFIDAGGNIYGTTAYGGKYGYGTVYKLTPTATGSNNYSESVLYSFTGGFGVTDPQTPWSGVVLHSDGNLYGTTINGGANGGCGTVFMLSPLVHGAVTYWTETTIHSFTGSGNDGCIPSSELTYDATKTHLYGTTRNGGTGGHGAVFMLTP